MTDIDREFLLFCVDMRLRGVHPDWMYIWRGSFLETGGEEWLCGAKKMIDDESWPMPCHFMPMDVSNTFSDLHMRYHNKGKPWWDQLQEKQE